MDRQSAIEFGRLIQRLRPDAPPAEPHGSLPEQMGDAARRIRAIAFTHLHRDHTAGILPLCEEREDPLRVFWTDYQAERVNVWTRQGREHVRQASCARPERLDGSPLHPLPGFPGIVAFAAGGHTPGSTVFFARVGDTTWILSGDITNFRANLIDDVPKEWVYSYLLVPEARGRLATLRPWLRGLDARDGWSVVVSHDRAALLESGLEPWRPARP